MSPGEQAVEGCLPSQAGRWGPHTPAWVDILLVRVRVLAVARSLGNFDTHLMAGTPPAVVQWEVDHKAASEYDGGALVYACRKMQAASFAYVAELQASGSVLELVPLREVVQPVVQPLPVFSMPISAFEDRQRL